ncbi:unnamed protein product [Dovyalis caffra]|uniref:Ripening-related protein 2 n=1 Tax=Dovyalis caffra TaxID=77055 RepID=A0AAV1QV64_9ROSI|nr:unnamed protein product [Dovyalis caffra]
MKSGCLKSSIPLLVILLLTHYCSHIEAEQRHPSGEVVGKKLPPGENDSDFCVPGKAYSTYRCSPPVSSRTKAFLTFNVFEEGGDIPSFCDAKNYSNDKPIVALSTGWFDNASRCLKRINVTANGRSVLALVVDECASAMGCDADNDYQPPCANNIVSASSAVWKALGVPHDKWDGLNITWSDA